MAKSPIVTYPLIVAGVSFLVFGFEIVTISGGLVDALPAIMTWAGNLRCAGAKLSATATAVAAGEGVAVGAGEGEGVGKGVGPAGGTTGCSVPPAIMTSPLSRIEAA